MLGLLFRILRWVVIYDDDDDDNFDDDDEYAKDDDNDDDEDDDGEEEYEGVDNDGKEVILSVMISQCEVKPSFSNKSTRH